MLLTGISTEAFVINTNGLPVSLNGTYVPYTGPVCM